jgi:Domain of unknown function (DUF4129)
VEAACASTLLPPRIPGLKAEQRVQHLFEAGPARRRVGGPIAVACVLGLLVAVVAAATRASLSRVGSAPPRVDTTAVIADVVVGVVLLVAAGAATLLLLGLLELRRTKSEDWFAIERLRAPWYERLLGLFVQLLLVAAAVAIVLRSHRRFPLPPGEGGRPAQGPASLTQHPRGSGGDRIDWLPILMAVGAVGVVTAAVVFVVRARLRRAWAGQPVEAPAAAVVEAIDESLDDLERERDPRRAVIRAYGRMERTLGEHGLARRAPETPLEYLARALQALAGSRQSAERLTRLFERAKFSPHPIDLRMRDEALAALAALRAELEPEPD